MAKRKAGEETMTNDKFIRGNDRLKEMLAKPGVAERVNEIREENRNLDRSYAMSLGMIREAGKLTQKELADRMEVSQGVVSKLEHSDNMLLQTLLRYLTASGADDIRVVVDIHGQEIEVDLRSMAESNSHRKDLQSH